MRVCIVGAVDLHYRRFVAYFCCYLSGSIHVSIGQGDLADEVAIGQQLGG